jgi:hypothetical protein
MKKWTLSLPSSLIITSISCLRLVPLMSIVITLATHQRCKMLIVKSWCFCLCKMKILGCKFPSAKCNFKLYQQNYFPCTNEWWSLDFCLHAITICHFESQPTTSGAYHHDVLVIMICNRTCNLSLWMARVHIKVVRISKLTLIGLFNPTTHRFCAHIHRYFNYIWV